MGVLEAVFPISVSGISASDLPCLSRMDNRNH